VHADGRLGVLAVGGADAVEDLPQLAAGERGQVGRGLRLLDLGDQELDMGAL
jgi:hypothetical protein